MNSSKLARIRLRALDPDALHNRSAALPCLMVFALAVQGYVSFGVSVVIVVLPYVVALALFLRHDRDRTRVIDDAMRTRLQLLLALQSLHSAEELVFRMYVGMPALFADLLYGDPSVAPPWSLDASLMGSFTMLAFFATAIGLHHLRSAITSFGIYMFVVSMCANAVFHPLYELYLLCSPTLAEHLRARNLSWIYFPGIVTSSFLGMLAFPLLRRLRS